MKDYRRKAKLSKLNDKLSEITSVKESAEKMDKEIGDMCVYTCV